MRHIQTAGKLMKLSFLLWLTRRRFYKGQHVSHKGRMDLPFLQKLRITHCFCTSRRAATSVIFLTQACSSRQTQHAPGREESSSERPRAVKSQPLREKFDSPCAGTLICKLNACKCTHAHGTRMCTFSKISSILGKSDPVGRPETSNFFG